MSSENIDYICDICKNNFDNEEYLLTNDTQKCILHCEKDDWYEIPYALKNWSKSDDKIKYFWQKIRDGIKVSKQNNEILNLKNSIFPEFERVEYTRFIRMVRDKEFDFIEYDIEGLSKSTSEPEFIIDTKIDFTGSSFLDDVNFNYYKFKKFTCFNNVEFYGKCNFQNTEFNEVSFNDCNFYKEVLFENAHLNLYSKGNRDDFINSIFHDNLKFYSTTLSSKESDKLFDIDFIGTQFKRVHFNGCISNKGGLRFLKDTKAEYLNIGSIDLKELYIAGEIPSIGIHGNNKTIDRLAIKHNALKDLLIHNCVIKGDFHLNDKIWNKDDIFELDNINLSESTFEGKVKIQFYTIKNEAKFYNTKFEDLVDFYSTKFNKVDFERTDFKDISVFSETEFNCDVDFKYTKFLGKSIFRDTVITGELNLRNTIFDDEANFLDITSQKRKKSYKDEYIGDAKEIEVSNRETARIIKNFYDNSNNIIEANKFYALEMKKREYELREAILEGHFKSILEYFVFTIHGITSNHSQDWFLSLLWIINITFMYTIVSSVTNYHNNMLATLFFYGVIFIFQNPRVLLKIISILGTLMFLFLSYINLDAIADKINPFSIMTSKDPMTFGLLIYKIAIAYLIYQFIVSVRQNTRRK